MCVRAIEWALKAKVGNIYAKLVLIVLANNASDETLQCWPSAEYIAERCEISRRSVYRAVIHLQENNFLTCQRRRWPNGMNRSPLYTLAVPSAPQTHPVPELGHNPVPLRALDEPSLEPSQRKTPLAEKVWIGCDSPDWEAWDSRWRTERGVGPPTTTHHSELGWWFDKEPKANGKLT